MTPTLAFVRLWVDGTLTRFQPETPSSYACESITRGVSLDAPRLQLCEVASWPCLVNTEDAQDVYEWILQNLALFDEKMITLGAFCPGATSL